jgi:hypothetical protein
MGVEAVFGSPGHCDVICDTTPYTTIEGLVAGENYKRRARANKPSFDPTTRVVNIVTNLSKPGGKTSDPNVGWLSSMLYCIYALRSDEAVSIDKHGLENRHGYFAGRNKLTKLMRFVAQKVPLTVAGLGLFEGSTQYDNEYWKYATTGEKLGSIMQEIELKSLGYKTLFSNHAGCEKTFLLGPHGDSAPMPSRGDYGIPDLVMHHPEKEELLIIEAETKRNYHKGLEQVRENKFKNMVDNICQQWYNVVSPEQVKVMVSTYGDGDDVLAHCVAHTTERGNTIINLGCAPVYTGRHLQG